MRGGDLVLAMTVQFVPFYGRRGFRKHRGAQVARQRPMIINPHKLNPGVTGQYIAFTPVTRGLCPKASLLRVKLIMLAQVSSWLFRWGTDDSVQIEKKKISHG